MVYTRRMFTVKQLAKIAGITPRTLHYYDEIGLLKPTTIGSNGYRYYSQQSLLRLQQILLYRELDLPLDRIKSILESDRFDLIQALSQHRNQLLKRIARTEKLINTVERTLNHLEGMTSMSTQQMFEGFNEEQQAEYAKEAEKLYDPEIVKASNLRWKNYTPEEKKRILEEGKHIYLDFIAAMPQGPASPEAQACVAAWRQHMSYFWTPEKPQLLGLAQGYNDDPRFRANFDQMHPKLAEFVLAAVRWYLEQ